MSLPPSIEEIYRNTPISSGGCQCPKCREFAQRIAAEACRLQREADRDWCLTQTAMPRFGLPQTRAPRRRAAKGLAMLEAAL